MFSFNYSPETVCFSGNNHYTLDEELDRREQGLSPIHALAFIMSDDETCMVYDDVIVTVNI